MLPNTISHFTLATSLNLTLAKLLTVGLILAGAQSASALEITFDFANNTDRATLNRNGATEFDGNKVRLVSDTPSQAGSLFYAPGGQGLFINSNTDFVTEFKFQVTGDQAPALRSDGLAFVIQGNGGGFIGDAGENLGYRNSTQTLSSYFYAVEFDTYFNSATGDLSDNEVAITRTDINNITTVLNSKDLTAAGKPLLDNGAIKNVKIDYSQHGQDRKLRVFLSENNDVPQLVLEELLPANMDLFHFGGASTYLGFTAATGAGRANYDLLSWSINVPEPSSIALWGIGVIGLVTSMAGRRKRVARK